jgi:hypothetical protein
MEGLHVVVPAKMWRISQAVIPVIYEDGTAHLMRGAILKWRKEQHSHITWMELDTPRQYTVESLSFLRTAAFRSSDTPQVSMASTEFSLEVVKESLSKEGFFYLEDLAFGEGILEIEKRGFEYFSEYGLDFCK